jgi:hypothetical protein
VEFRDYVSLLIADQRKDFLATFRRVEKKLSHTEVVRQTLVITGREVSEVLTGFGVSFAFKDGFVVALNLMGHVMKAHMDDVHLHIIKTENPFSISEGWIFTENFTL